jgi:hypothetical protein
MLVSEFSMETKASEAKIWQIFTNSGKESG